MSLQDVINNTDTCRVQRWLPMAWTGKDARDPLDFAISGGIYPEGRYAFRLYWSSVRRPSASETISMPPNFQSPDLVTKTE